MESNANKPGVKTEAKYDLKFPPIPKLLARLGEGRKGDSKR